MGSCLDSKCAMFTQVCLGPDWNLLHIFHLQCWSLIHLNAVKGTSLSFFYFQVLPFEPDVTTRLKYGGGGESVRESFFFSLDFLQIIIRIPSSTTHPPPFLEFVRIWKKINVYIFTSICPVAFFVFVWIRIFQKGPRWKTISEVIASKYVVPCLLKSWVISFIVCLKTKDSLRPRILLRTRCSICFMSQRQVPAPCCRRNSKINSTSSIDRLRLATE